GRKRKSIGLVHAPFVTVPPPTSTLATEGFACYERKKRLCEHPPSSRVAFEKMKNVPVATASFTPPPPGSSFYTLVSSGFVMRLNEIALAGSECIACLLSQGVIPLGLSTSWHYRVPSLLPGRERLPFVAIHDKKALR